MSALVPEDPVAADVEVPYEKAGLSEVKETDSRDTSSFDRPKPKAPWWSYIWVCRFDCLPL
jgi:hypothetical protein